MRPANADGAERGRAAWGEDALPPGEDRGAGRRELSLRNRQRRHRPDLRQLRRVAALLLERELRLPAYSLGDRKSVV